MKTPEVKSCFAHCSHCGRGSKTARATTKLRSIAEAPVGAKNNGSLAHNHQMMVLKQILQAKTPPTMNSGGMQDHTPRLTEMQVMAMF